MFVFFKEIPICLPKISTNAKSTQNGINQLHEPYGVYIDNDQIIYLVDKYNARIMEWKNNLLVKQ